MMFYTDAASEWTNSADSLDRCITALVLETNPAVPWDAETLADHLDWPKIGEVADAVSRLCAAGIIGRIE